MGFVALPRLLLEIEKLGFVRSDVRDAAHFCLTKELIEVETSSLDTIRDRDSVKATASGWAHIRLLSSRIEYLASVLPTTPINDKQFSARVFDMMQMESRAGYIYFHQAVQLVQGLQSYLRRQCEEFRAHPGFADRPHSGSEYILGKIEDALTYARKEGAKATGQPDLLDV
jgi:hypothetical protein